MNMLKQTSNDRQKVEVRKLREADFFQLPKIYRQSLKDNPAGFVQDLAFHGEITEIARQIIEGKGAVLVADINGKIVGFGALKPHEDGSVELCKLHVSKGYQGYGIGKSLSQHLIALAEELGYGTVTLHVTATQKAAIGLYRKLGFYKTDQQVFSFEVNRQKLKYDTIFMEYPIIPLSSRQDADDRKGSYKRI